MPFATETPYSGTLQLELLADGQVAISASITGGNFEETFQLAATDAQTLTQLDTVAFAIGSGGGAAAAGTLTLYNIRLDYHPSTTGGAPIITEQPADRSVLTGSTVTFAASASSSGTMSYQWRKDGVILPGATQPTLTITNVQSADAGRYAVQISSSGGITLSRAATLAVTVGGYSAFISAHGLAGADAGPAADPDADGFANVLEYLLGGNPLIADAALAPQLSFDATANLWRLTFRVRATTTSLLWSIETSATLQSWNPVANGVDGARIESTPDGTGFLQITATMPAGSTPLFFRVRAELP